MTAGELCIRRVITAEPTETVVDAARRMIDENVGDLIVVEMIGDKVHPIGILTDRDLVGGALARGTPEALQIRVRDVMQADVVTAYENEGADQVLAKLQRYKIRRLPIVDHTGALQGILTLDDMLTWIREQIDHAAHVVEHQASVVR
jgi:CBS domain-containing protein